MEEQVDQPQKKEDNLSTEGDEMSASGEVFPVWTEARIRMLKRSIAVMTVLLVIGVGLLVYKILDVASQPSTKENKLALNRTPQAAIPVPISQPVSNPASKAWLKKIDLNLEGFQLVNSQLSGNHLLLQTKKEEAMQLLIVDLRSGKIISRISLTGIRGDQ